MSSDSTKVEENGSSSAAEAPETPVPAPVMLNGIPIPPEVARKNPSGLKTFLYNPKLLTDTDRGSLERLESLRSVPVDVAARAAQARAMHDDAENPVYNAFALAPSRGAVAIPLGVSYTPAPKRSNVSKDTTKDNDTTKDTIKVDDTTKDTTKDNDDTTAKDTTTNLKDGGRSGKDGQGAVIGASMPGGSCAALSRLRSDLLAGAFVGTVVGLGTVAGTRIDAHARESLEASRSPVRSLWRTLEYTHGRRDLGSGAIEDGPAGKTFRARLSRAAGTAVGASPQAARFAAAAVLIGAGREAMGSLRGTYGATLEDGALGGAAVGVVAGFVVGAVPAVSRAMGIAGRGVPAIRYAAVAMGLGMVLADSRLKDVTESLF